MKRNAIPFAILVLCLILALLAGCATYGYQFTDADGSNVAVHDRSFLSRRDLADTASAYEWGGDGSGNWKIGQTLEGTNSTEALPVIRDFFTAFFAAVSEALKLYSASVAAPTSAGEIVLTPIE